ncbi:hypothetical protein [Devosia sp.]|uniref:hypothetical protein n=1 Tax=Devosia sp. TaxID=1871048 RepID=UPI002734D7C1|nr:hypothetical protein [Devosia sp.]MDP2780177.1 hypothetical protein [Devosia sp.]
MKPFVFAILAVLALAGPAQAQFTSAYTDLDLDNDCLVLDADDFGVSWSCPGYKGYPVHVSEGDLRFTIVYGFNIDKEPGGQTLGPFNRLGDTLEWRLSKASGRWLPVATIVRYHIADIDTGVDSGQVLVVTQLAEGNSCHIAYVDARANTNANELARAAADRAGNFDCGTDTIATPGTFAAW